MTVSVMTRPGVRGQVDSRAIRRRLIKLLKGLGEDLSEVSLLLTDDEEIRRLNLEYRNNDSATDVLSFPQLMDNSPVFQGQPRILGDVIISLETAARQRLEGCLPRLHRTMSQAGLDHILSVWPLNAEVTFLLVHGVLHLLGHDHMEEHERAKMEAREGELLPTLFKITATDQRSAG